MFICKSAIFLETGVDLPVTQQQQGMRPPRKPEFNGIQSSAVAAAAAGGRPPSSSSSSSSCNGLHCKSFSNLSSWAWGGRPPTAAARNSSLGGVYPPHQQHAAWGGHAPNDAAAGPEKELGGVYQIAQHQPSGHPWGG